jgi:hypothetical protein
MHDACSNGNKLKENMETHLPHWFVSQILWALAVVCHVIIADYSVCTVYTKHRES